MCGGSVPKPAREKIKHNPERTQGIGTKDARFTKKFVFSHR
jgi:hypothetical protein